MKKIVLAFMVAGMCFGFAQTGFSAILNFNKASADEIVQVTEGLVDDSLAKAIVDYREKNGPFKNAEDLQSVPGMKSVIFSSLDPEVKDGDVVYSTDVKPGMKAY